MATIDLVVARTRIAGGVELAREAPATLRASAGDRLLVKFPYRYDEVSRGEDSWRVRLSARLGDEEPAPAVKASQDRRAVADDARGFVQHIFELEPGERTLHFDALVEVRDGPWDAAGRETVVEQVEGQTKIVVET